MIWIHTILELKALGESRYISEGIIEDTVVNFKKGLRYCNHQGIEIESSAVKNTKSRQNKHIIQQKPYRDRDPLLFNATHQHPY